ncbi:SsgA family sporulation/cell division regulator [Streptomyces longwoodensis]|uniref:SsgA family sporulation/cell division regulator n=1 Tax=Streptomyces longwoodensis TaxID=68231 RepID=UPI002E80A2D9|nr:SsgA family sporulation/cell division regulator [Streptomyces longwoodensis]WUC55747.1 SsgA family sporulation/cell division regulator [Streptomyces longwoodensis]WUC62134.1 SsgA family sporulation/cell division regulator [Streptomyces longwoodensis]
MDNFATADDDFEALLNASSLGAPHVLAENLPIPADVHRRLAKAAAAPTPRPTEPGMQHQTNAGRIVHSADLWQQLKDGQQHLETLRNLLQRNVAVVLVGAPGSGKSAVAARLLADLAVDEHAAHRAPMPAWPDGMWQQAGQDRGYVVQVPCSLPALTGTWDFTLTRTFTYTLTPPARTQLPLYLCDDLADRPMAQPGIQPAQMTDLLTVEEVGRANTAKLRPDLWAGTQQVRVWQTDCCPHSTGQAAALPRTTDGNQAEWPRTRSTGILSFAAPRATPLGTRHTISLQRALRLPADSTRYRAWPGVLLAHPSIALPQTVCTLAWAEPSLLRGHPPLLPHPWVVLHGCSSPSTLPFLQRPFSGSRSEPQCDKPAQPMGTAGTALRMWTDTAEDGTAQHALLQMTIHQDKSGNRLDMPVRLTYRPTDPYAVEAVFYPDDPRGEVVWTFARDLLIEGLEHSAGEGDVIVWSPPTPAAKLEQRRTFIRLHSLDGTAVLSASHAHLKQYISTTQRLVAAGNEHQLIDSSLDVLDREWGNLACPGSGD